MNTANDNTALHTCGEPAPDVVIGVVHDDPDTCAILFGEEVLHAIKLAAVPAPVRIEFRRFGSRKELEEAYARACEIAEESA